MNNCDTCDNEHRLQVMTPSGDFKAALCPDCCLQLAADLVAVLDACTSDPAHTAPGAKAQQAREHYEHLRAIASGITQ